MALPEMMSAWTEGLMRRRERSAGFGAVLRNLGSDDRGFGESLLGREPGDSPDDRNSQASRLLDRRRHRFSQLRRVLGDAQQCAFVIVLAAERLQVPENIELHEQLQRSGVSVAGPVIN